MSYITQKVTGSIVPGTIDEIVTDAGTVTPNPASDSISIIGFPGSGITTDGGTLYTVYLKSTFTPPVTWNVVTTATQALAVNNGYILRRAGDVVLTLPAVCAVGDVIKISGNIFGVVGNFWQVNQNAGQAIYIGQNVTTLGVAGYLKTWTSQLPMACAELLCIEANSLWILQNYHGNIANF